MNRTAWLASAFLTTVMIARSLAAADRGLYLIVTPERDPSGSIGCSVQPETQPPALTNDAVRLLVTLEGTATPVTWRLPLYRTNNGANDIAVARVGEGKPDRERRFVVRVTAADLQRTEGLDDLRLELRTRDGREAFCSIKAEPLRVAARQAPPAEATPGLADGLRFKAAVDR